MNIIKASGSTEKFDLAKIRKVTQPACDGLKVSLEELEYKAHMTFKDGMKSSEIQDMLEKAAISMMDIDNQDATYVAARLKIYKYYTSVLANYGLSRRGESNPYNLIHLRDYIEFNKEYLTLEPELYDMDKLNDAIEYDRDLLMNYLGADAITRKYALPFNGGNRELPQHVHMRVAMFISRNAVNPTETAIHRYNMYSELKFLHGTPTTANGGTIGGNTFSCAVGSHEDTLTAIFNGYQTKAQGSKFGSGWGWDWSRTRALGSIIDGVKHASSGMMPYLKIDNDVSIAVDQLSTRPGAFNETCVDWHMDIFNFMKMKKNGGEEKSSAKELFMTLAAHDEFMRRVENNDQWTLFDPYDTPDLNELYGDAFTERYKYYEELSKTNPEFFNLEPVVIEANEIFREFIPLAYEVGNPSILYIDTANNSLKPDYDRDGLIRCPNLCLEFLSPIKDDEIPVCNLGSINLARVSKDELWGYAYAGHMALNDVIDVATYRIPNSEKLEKDRRSVGLGIAGEAEAIVQLGIEYGSDAHIAWINDIYSIIEDASDQASRDLVGLRDYKNTYGDGFANMHRRCIAPTSTLGLLFGTTNAHLPVFERAYIEEGLAGNFVVTVPNLNPDNWNLYTPANELDQIKLVQVNGVRSKYFDMGISNSIYFKPENNVSGKMILDVYMEAWRAGNKTVYYCVTGSKRDNTDEDELRIVNTEKEIVCEGCA